MCCSNQLNTAFCNCSCGCCLEFCSNFVDDDNFRHMIFNGFNHNLMLILRIPDLHSTSFSN
uniref:Ycf27 n=1 Tax=Tisochrysis lutea TaxID=1321669 RepID=A0A3Q9SXB4_9EUKA|nr:Ycf27 [Tisochrysis lutea]AZW07323.1 Ycf27 [Tisochrysis lutea]